MARNDIPRSFRFQPEEIELLERLAGTHKSAKAAIIAGLRSLEADGTGKDVRADVAARLRAMAEALEPAKPKGKRK